MLAVENSHIRLKPFNSIDYVRVAFECLNSGGSFEQGVEANGSVNLVNVSTDFGWYHGTDYKPSSSENTAQILYTSGTTGVPKAVHISHRALKNTTERVASIMEMTSDVKEYIGVPVTYSFGFGRCRAVSLVGGKFFVPQKFDPLEIAEMLTRNEINAISAVPSLWRVLLSVKELFPLSIGSKVGWIEIGSQYMSAEEKLQLTELFPNAKIVQHYGLTEASRSTFLKIHEKQALESVGKTYFEGVDVRVNSNGRIAISGPHLASKIEGSDSYTTFSNNESWFETSDLGKIENGFLYFLGRDDDVINCGGVKLSPEELEAKLSKAINITAGTYAIFKNVDELRGEVPAVAILKSKASKKTELIISLNELLKEKKLDIGSLVKVIEVDTLPTTATNKVKRKELAQSLSLKSRDDLKQEDDEPNKVEKGEFEQVIINTLKKVLKVKHVGPNDSIKSLGGDSLSTLLLMIQLEKSGLPSDEIKWLVDGATLQQMMEKKANKQHQFSAKKMVKPLQRKNFISSDKNISMFAVRGLFVLINILAHWSIGIFERLPHPFDGLNHYLAIVFNSGTTGFALMFGFTFGSQIANNTRKTNSEIVKAAISNAKILFFGMFALALLKVMKVHTNGDYVDSLIISNSFYSVLYYYFFAVLTLPFFISMWRKKAYTVPLAATFFAIFWLISVTIKDAAITPSTEPLTQLGILLITAKYDFFGMSAIVMLGVAAGYLLRMNVATAYKVKILSAISLLSIAVSCAVLNTELFRWFIWPTSTLYISMAFLYLSVIVFLDSILIQLLRNATLPQSIVFFIKIITTIGLLAFPLFVLHELVLPSVSILKNIGFGSFAYIGFFLFFAVSYNLCKKVFKVV